MERTEVNGQPGALDARRRRPALQRVRAGHRRRRPVQTVRSISTRTSWRTSAGWPRARPPAPPPDMASLRGMVDADLALRASGLTKRYGATLALDGLDLAIRAGRGVRIPGPERRRQDDDDPAACSACSGRPPAASRVFGIDAWRDPVRAHRRVAFVAGEPMLWPALTGLECLEFLARLHGGVDAALPARADRAVRASIRASGCATTPRATGRRSS